MKTRIFSLFVLVVSLASLLMPDTAVAGGAPMGGHNVEFLAQIGGEPYAIAVQGTYAYVGVGPNLFVLDIANPAIPQVAGHLLLPDTVRGVAVVGNYAYVGNRWSGLRVIDISEPTDPLEVGSWQLGGWAHGVAVAGEDAYLATSDGLSIINVADPANPVYTGGIATQGYGQHVVVRGGYAYYADNSAGLRIIDISNPAAPEEVGRCETVNAKDVALAGNYAYVASDKDGGLLKVVDVSNPAQPQQVASCDAPGGGTNAVSVSGTYVFLGTHSGSDTELGVRIIDISNPLVPNPVGFYDVPGWSAQDVVVAASYAYATCGLDGGMRVVDVSDPTSPAEVGAWATLGMTGQVAAVDDYAYISRSGVSSIINAADPAHPTVVGSMPWSFSDFEAAGSYAFLASGDLRILDISDPTNPTEVSSFDAPSYISCLARAGQYVYLAERGWWDGSQYAGGGLRIIDVSNISSPEQVGYLSMPGLAEGVAVTGEHVYLAYRDEGLRIINVSDPTNPVQVGSLASQEWYQYQDVTTDKHYVYWLTGWSRALHVLNVSDPAHPLEVGTCETLQPAERVKVVGSYAFVQNMSGLYVIDVSVPTNPIAIAWYGTTGDSTSGMAITGNLAYVTSQQSGVYLLRPLRDDVSGTIDTAGGSLSSTSADTNFIFRTGVVTDTVQLAYRHLLFDENTIGNLVGIAHTFDVTAVYSTTSQPALLAPGHTYTITVQYTDAEQGPAIENALALYYWDGSEWVKEPSSVVDTVANEITATPDHFSRWAVLGETRRVYLPLVLKSH